MYVVSVNASTTGRDQSVAYAVTSVLYQTAAVMDSVCWASASALGDMSDKLVKRVSLLLFTVILLGTPCIHLIWEGVVALKTRRAAFQLVSSLLSTKSCCDWNFFELIF